MGMDRHGNGYDPPYPVNECAKCGRPEGSWESGSLMDFVEVGDRLLCEVCRPADDARPDGDTPAPSGQVFVCGACGKTAASRHAFRDVSCMTHAVLCYEQNDEDKAAPRWRAVPKISDGTILETLVTLKLIK